MSNTNLLRTLTTTRSGVAVPKQFCSLQGGPSLLQEALQRAEAVAPRQRIVTIVAQQHRQWWEGPLWRLFLEDERGLRPVLGQYPELQRDPHFRDYVLGYRRTRRMTVTRGGPVEKAVNS